MPTSGRRRRWIRSRMAAAGLAEVRDAAGDATIATTSIYTPVATDDEGKVRSLFAFDAA